VALAVRKPSAQPTPNAPVVVVVDDDDEIRSMLVKALGQIFTVYEARDGEDARALFEAIPPPAAMVSDVMMPRMDGIELAKMLRKKPALARMPILFLTAKTTPLDIVAGINAGARHYVTKPFKLVEVLTKVKAMAGVK
jgi:DNA-binding response OmpR family regulator